MVDLYIAPLHTCTIHARITHSYPSRPVVFTYRVFLNLHYGTYSSNGCGTQMISVEYLIKWISPVKVIRNESLISTDINT